MMQVIRHPSDMIEITVAGKDFLKYLLHRGREADQRKFRLDRAKSKIREGETTSLEKHFTPAELATAWNVSAQTIREIFRREPGVLKIGSNATKTRRAYKMLRIPASVAERVHNRPDSQHSVATTALAASLLANRAGFEPALPNYMGSTPSVLRSSLSGFLVIGRREPTDS